MEEELLEFCKNLENEYGISLNRIKSYYSKLMNIPCVSENDEELLMECLERIVQDMSTNEFIRSKENNAEQIQKEYNYIFSDALYNVYGDDSTDYLDENYKKMNEYRHI